MGMKKTRLWSPCHLKIDYKGCNLLLCTRLMLNFPCSLHMSVTTTKFIIFFGGGKYTVSPLTQTLGRTRPPCHPRELCPCPGQKVSTTSGLPQFSFLQIPTNRPDQKRKTAVWAMHWLPRVWIKPRSVQLANHNTMEENACHTKLIYQLLLSFIVLRNLYYRVIWKDQYIYLSFITICAQFHSNTVILLGHSWGKKLKLFLTRTPSSTTSLRSCS